MALTAIASEFVRVCVCLCACMCVCVCVCVCVCIQSMRECDDWISFHINGLCHTYYLDILDGSSYRVAKTHRIPQVADHFPQKSH